MLNKNQEQTASDGANAVQAGGDVRIDQTINYGLSVNDVRELVPVFLREHLPMLQQAARQEAEANAQVFVEKLITRLHQEGKIGLLNKLNRPATQASFTEAVIGAAKRGDEMDLDLLSAAVVSRFGASETSVLRFVTEDAASVLPKLNGTHIAFLTLAFSLQRITFTGATSMDHLEELHTKMLPLIESGMTISEPHKGYLEGLGLISINRVADANIYDDGRKHKYPFYDAMAVEKGQFPALKKFRDAHIAVLLPAVSISATAICIACLHLRGAFPVDLSIFLGKD